MHPSQTRWMVLIGLLAACGSRYVALTNTPDPTAVLRSLPTLTASPELPTLAFTPAAVTPLDPTTTPVVHTVREGDTLLGIAFEHGVTLDALQTANDGIDPLSLQPGQTIFIPLSDGDPARPTPTPMPLAVSPFHCYATPSGGHLCLGQARNTGAEAIINLAVQVTLVLPYGSADVSKVSVAPLDVLWPGQSLPLGVRFAGGTRVLSATTQVLSADSGAGLADRFAELDVQELSGEPGQPAGYLVHGRVFNGRDLLASEIKIVVTLYGEDGAVKAFRQVGIMETLPAREGLPFTVAFPAIPEEVVGYAAAAQGRIFRAVEE